MHHNELIQISMNYVDCVEPESYMPDQIGEDHMPTQSHLYLVIYDIG